MSENEIKTCVDMGHAPAEPDQATPSSAAAPGTPTPAGGRARAALLIAKKWPNDSVLRVHFMDGDAEVQKKVEAYAHLWSRYSNLRLKFVDDPDAEIRISFKEPGSWSYIGTDARGISKRKPTMNYGWLTPRSADSEYERVVVHEFGHAFGLIHEHQNPGGEIPWNKPAVYEYYSGPPNNWDKGQVDTNLFKKYSKRQARFTGFDPESIMLYPIPNEFTVGDFEVGWNRSMSDSDKRFIGTIYPKPAHELQVDDPPREGSISKKGEIDTYIVNIFEEGRYRFETNGRADLIMSLYGPEDDSLFIDQDDDSGRRLNPRIEADLGWGRYTVRVQHFSDERTGDYSIQVTAAE